MRYFLAVLLVISTGWAMAESVMESAREIPVAYEVDVMVVGGATGGVTAAVAAAEAGASVFLAAQRPYLGVDMCGTYRLWLEPGETPDTPLAKILYHAPDPVIPLGKGLPFTYTADQPSEAIHPDTDPPSLLCDKKWHAANNQSVQYADDVTLVLDLGESQPLGKVHLLAYQRPSDFVVGAMTVAVSDDGSDWKAAAAISNPVSGAERYEGESLRITTALNASGRYLKITVTKADVAKRILLSEIIVEAPSADTAAKEAPVAHPPRPMQIKYALDQALIEAGVAFLYGSYVTDLIYDEEDTLSGAVIVNRSGRQAVLAKRIVDATPNAVVARMAGAQYAEALPDTRHFSRIVVGGDPVEDAALKVHTMPSPVLVSQPGQMGKTYTAYEYTWETTLGDAVFIDYSAFAAMEQEFRDKTFHVNQVAASDVLYEFPPVALGCEAALSGEWSGVEEVSLATFRAKDVPGIYLLNGYAGVSRAAAATMLRPINYMELGSRIGREAAQEALAAPSLDRENLQTPGMMLGERTVPGAVREFLDGARPSPEVMPSITGMPRNLPVLAQYDVVVIGGGTGGAPAGIAAARQGAKTLVVEYLHGLGGVGTLGLIGRYYYGNVVGFSVEVNEGVATLAGKPDQPWKEWQTEQKMEWYRSELRKAGADLWFAAIGCGAFVQEGVVKGVVVATPQGRGVVLAKTVIDSTGNSDIAAAAGAACIYTDASNVAVQGTGLPPRKPGAFYTNTDYTLTDDTSTTDRWRSFVTAHAKYKTAYDSGQLIDTRERRRIVGEFIISPLDILNGRTYPDTISRHYSNFDTHGYTIHPVFSLSPPDKVGMFGDVPYRCLLPKGLDGILVTGLGISAHRDAMPILRMQADIQNQGYAAGVAAAMSVKSERSVRNIDVKALQQHLVEKGNLVASHLTDHDLFPQPLETVLEAVKQLADGYAGLPRVLAQQEDALMYLQESYHAAETEEARLIYAHVLGMLGDATGAETLKETVATLPWDEGWSFTGMGQFGMSMSQLDSYMIALAYTQAPEALALTLDKMAALDADADFSHHRAVAVALETLGDSKAAPALAALLGKPGMRGHAAMDIHASMEDGQYSNPNESRNVSLRELILARALYRCGDYEGLGETILNEYARDLRGHHARHAIAVLEER